MSQLLLFYYNVLLSSAKFYFSLTFMFDYSLGSRQVSLKSVIPHTVNQVVIHTQQTIAEQKAEVSADVSNEADVVIDVVLLSQVIFPVQVCEVDGQLLIRLRGLLHGSQIEFTLLASGRAPRQFEYFPLVHGVDAGYDQGNCYAVPIKVAYFEEEFFFALRQVFTLDCEQKIETAGSANILLPVDYLSK